jgi:putative endonuclease
MVAYVYIMANARNGTLYIGVTSSLIRRIYEHRTDVAPGFTSQYGVHMLVHFEMFGDIYEAIRREKRLKKWPREWKIALKEASNPEWRDLYPEIVGEDGCPA